MDAIRLAQPPVHRRVKRWLTDKISSGEWKPGTRLPGEYELARSLGISRASVREALLILEQEGLVVRKQGVGTFVSTPMIRVSAGLGSLQSITDLIRSTGRRPGTSDISTRMEGADETVAKKLQVEPGDPVLVIRRTRTADGIPVAFCLTFLPAEIAGTEIDLALYDGSLLKYLDEVRGHKATSAVCKVIATKPGTYVARKLRIPEGDSILLLEQVMYDSDNRALMFSRDHFNPSEVEFWITRR